MKHSKTEVICGLKSVTLLTAGRNAIERTIEALEEIIINTTDHGVICGPARNARDALAVLMDRVNAPPVRGKQSVATAPRVLGPSTPATPKKDSVIF